MDLRPGELRPTGLGHPRPLPVEGHRIASHRMARGPDLILSSERYRMVRGRSRATRYQDVPGNPERVGNRITGLERWAGILSEVRWEGVGCSQPLASVRVRDV
jgi:hypothetical protein